MMDAVPHPLVAGLVQQLLRRRVEGFDANEMVELAKRLADPDDANLAAAVQAEPPDEEQTKALVASLEELLEEQPNQLTDAQRGRLVDAAEQVEIPELVVLAGYLGGTVDIDLHGQDATWRVLYIDSQLQNWRLVPNRDIVLYDSIDADDAPFKRRDLIWVMANALTARGGAPPRPKEQARFLRGDFTRAGDLSVPSGGGTQSGATGIFCEAITPRCCTRPVRP